MTTSKMNDKANTIELLVDEINKKIHLKPIKDVNKSHLNGHKIVTLNLINADNPFIEITPSVLDLNKISCLDFSRCNLNALPDVFGVLQLEQLDLSHNEFKYVPDCLRDGLRFLEILDLSHNNLKCFDEQPKCVKRLRVLKINNNSLLGVPRWILNVNCFNLEELYYGCNEIITLKRSEFRTKSSYSLRRLEMNNCSIRSEDIPFFKHIRTLEILNLSNGDKKTQQNCFSDYDLFVTLFDKSSWSNTLKVLYLNKLQCTYLPEEICQLVVLEELYLTHNDLLWLPNTIVTLEKLRILDLSYNNLAGLPKEMGKMKSLTSLIVPYNNISKIPEFPNVTNLQILDFYDNNLEDDCDINVELLSIPKLDFERNYFNTYSLNDYDYQIKKTSLRNDQYNTRIDGPKEWEQDLYEDTVTTDSDSALTDGNDNEETCNQEDQHWEEPWDEYLNNTCGASEDGCTASDNEWTGFENIIFKAPRKKTLERYPSWMFEDVLDD